MHFIQFLGNLQILSLVIYSLISTKVGNKIFPKKLGIKFVKK